MKLTRLFLLNIFLIYFSTSIKAMEVNNSSHLTLSELMYLAIERNIDTRKALINIQIAEKELDAGKSVYYPYISATGGYTNNKRDYNGKVKIQDTYGTINMDYEIFTFGKNTNKIKALQHYLNSIKYQEDYITQNIIYRVIENYYNLLSLESKKEAAIEIEKSSLEAFKSASLKHKIGVVPLVDKLKSSNLHSKNVLSRIKIENAIKQQKAELNNVLNLEPNYVLNVEKPEININKINNNIEYYIQEALKNRPDLKQLKETQKQKKKELVALQLSRLPKVNLSGSISSNKEKYDGNLLDRKRNRTIALTVSIPLFSGFYTISSINILENEIKNINLEIEQLNKSISKEVWNVFYDFDTAQKSYFVAKDLLNTAKENAKIQLGMYKNSKCSMLDVLDSQDQLENARYEFINSQYSLLIYRMKLLKTIGKMNLENIINIDRL